MREALVAGHGECAATFLAGQPAADRREVEQLEARIRRRDILVDEQALMDFYRANPGAGARPPLSRSGDAAGAAEALLMLRADVMRREAPEATTASHPDRLRVAGNELPLQYWFEPNGRAMASP